MPATPNLQPNASGDPFTLVFCGLWDMLENSKAFVGVVAPPNRIKWIGDKVDPRKDQQTDSDRPEVRADPAEEFAVPDQLSGTDLLRCQWNIIAATDKQQLDRRGHAALGASILPVLWAIYASLLGYGQAIKNLQYNGANFVYRVKPGVPRVSIDNSKLQQGLVGWTAVWPYYTWLEFTTLANLAALVP
ncbi:MAG: hypothetical protein ABR915_18485 [Thermoguttaceae bacterium]